MKTGSVKHLLHNEILAEAGDVITLRFPNEETVDVVVVEYSDARLIVDAGGGVSFEFERSVLPYAFTNTSMGPVCGELKMWRCAGMGNTPPCMIVANLGKLQAE